MKRTILALVMTPLSLPLAFAQAPSVPPPPAADTQTPAPPPSDLDARLHHQPTQAEVNEREKAREGGAAVEQQNKQQQKQVDQLYQQLLGTPAAK